MGKINKIIIYHNTNCSKSCSALATLKQTGAQFELIEYLKAVPSVEDLRGIVGKLKCAPHDLIRKTEPIYVEKFKGKNLSDEEWLNAMHENPILIQRPIVIKGDKAVIARSSDALEDVINL